MSKCVVLVSLVRLYRGMLLSGILLEQEKQQDQSFLPFSEEKDAILWKIVMKAACWLPIKFLSIAHIMFCSPEVSVF